MTAKTFNRRTHQGDRTLRKDLDDLAGRGGFVVPSPRSLTVRVKTAAPPPTAGAGLPSSGPMIMNDGASPTDMWFLYGRDSAGLVTAAWADSSAPVKPLWQAQSVAATGMRFRAFTEGETKVWLDVPTALPTVGAQVWLSAAASGAGKVTATAPANPDKRMWIGTFRRATLETDGTILVDLNVFAQTGGAL